MITHPKPSPNPNRYDVTDMMTHPILNLSISPCSRCYGPAITPVSSLVVPSLEKLINVRRGDEWDFVEEDAAPANRTSRQYLFHTAQHSTRCYDTSAWTKRVKAAFQRFSPSGSSTPPRLLRSAFVTALRSDPDCPKEILESAGINF